MALNNLGLGFLFTAKDLASGVMSRVRQNFVKTEGATSDAAASIGRSFGAFTTGLAIAGVGLGAFAVLSATTADARDFSKAIALVATEADEATFSTDKMRDVSIALAGTFGKMPVDEAEALYKAVALGADDATKATHIMTAANQLAVAGNAELKSTMDALGGTLNAYHLQASDAAQVSDAFFIAMKNGNTTVQDLASSVGRVNAGAAVMGISVQEVLGSISVMTNKGVQASEAVSMLHGALANITHPSHDAAAEAQRLGIKFNAAAVRSMGFTKFLHSIVDNAKFTKDTLAKLFTSVEGSNAMAMLAGDMGAVDAVMEKMRTETGATKAGFDIMTDTLDFQEKRMAALQKTASILIGESLETGKVAAVKFGANIVEAFTKIPKPMRDILVRGAALAATLLVIVGGALAVTSAVGLMMSGLAAAGITMSGFLLTVLPVTLALGAVVLAFLAFREAYDQNLGGFADYFDNIYKKVRLTYLALVQVFSQGGFSGAVLKELDAGNDDVENFVVRIYLAVNRIRNFFKGLSDGFYDSIEGLKPAFQEFMTSLERLGFQFFSFYDAVDPKDAKNKFDSFGLAGKKVGAVVAELVGKGIKLATAFIDLLIALKPIADGAVDLVAKFSGIDNIISVVKLGLELYVAYLTAKAIMATLSMGGAAVEAAIAIGQMASAMGTAAAAGAAQQGIVGFTASVVGSINPVVALTFAVLALYKAWSLYKDLDQKSHGHGMALWALNARKNLGLINDEDYARERVKLTGDTGDASSYAQAGREAAMKRQDAALAAGYGQSYAPLEEPPPAPPTYAPEDLVSSPGNGSEGVKDAIVDLSDAVRGQSIVVPVTLMTPDGDVLAQMVAKGGRTSAGQSFSPIASGVP